MATTRLKSIARSTDCLRDGKFYFNGARSFGWILLKLDLIDGEDLKDFVSRWSHLYNGMDEYLRIVRKSRKKPRKHRKTEPSVI